MKNLFFSLVIFFLFCGQVAAGSTVQTEAFDKARSISRQFHKTMVVCPDRIWPEYSWESFQVIFVHPELSVFWLWDAQRNQITELENTELPEEASGSIYNFFEFNGKPTMSLDITDSDETFELGVHEFFHDQGQLDSLESSGLRGTRFPLNPEPRILRSMLLRNLLKAFRSIDESEYNAALGHAAYWYDEWKNRFPYEVVNATDGYEGTANYVETVAKVIAKNDCEISEESLLSKIREEFASFEPGVQSLLDEEGYEIGNLATLLLRKQFSNDRQFYMSLVDGVHPTALLFQSVTPVPEDIDQKVADLYQVEIERLNVSLGDTVGANLRNYDDVGYLRIAFPFSWIQSNFMPSGMYLSEITEGTVIAPLMFSHKFSYLDSFVNLSASTTVFLTSGDSHPCGSSNDLTVLVAESDLRFRDDNYIIISSPEVSGSMAGSTVMDPKGKRYFCAKGSEKELTQISMPASELKQLVVASFL